MQGVLNLKQREALNNSQVLIFVVFFWFIWFAERREGSDCPRVSNYMFFWRSFISFGNDVLYDFLWEVSSLSRCRMRSGWSYDVVTGRMNLRNFRSSGSTETYMYMLSMSALMWYFRSRKRQITASRWLTRPGPDKSMSLSATPLSLDFAFEHLRSFPGLVGFVIPFSGSIQPVEGISSLGNSRM